MILVSSCLTGVSCKYNGKDNYNAKVMDFIADNDYVLVCPEMLGGLQTPRLPAEIVGTQVINKEGQNLTSAFKEGAKKSLDLAKKHNASLCILKENSPSCGVHSIYDGTFTNCKVIGMGITAKLLKVNGFKVISEKDVK